jgi:hypothetical protein
MRLVERRESNETVDAALGLEDPVGVLTLHRERGRFETGLLARRRLDDLGAEAPVGRPAEIHAEEHLGPVLRVGSARARVDGDDGIAGVVLAREEGVFLQALKLLLERLDA